MIMEMKVLLIHHTVFLTLTKLNSFASCSSKESVVVYDFSLLITVIENEIIIQ